MNDAYIFMDCEYTWACALREGMIPNYKVILNILNKAYPNNVKHAYFVGNRSKKKAISDFLIKNGVDFVNVTNIQRCYKTQIVAPTMTIDVMERIISAKDCKKFVFVTGDDYMVPIVEYLAKFDVEVDLYYFPIILSKALENKKVKLIRLFGCYLAHQMTAKEIIEKRRKEKRFEEILFTVLEDGDAIINNGRYANMKLSDIFIIYPLFIDWIIGDSRMNSTLKEIAKNIKNESEIFSDSIAREIVMGV